jgi:hypothetical protein
MSDSHLKFTVSVVPKLYTNLSLVAAFTFLGSKISAPMSRLTL